MTEEQMMHYGTIFLNIETHLEHGD
jgi:hypothetical protein